MKRTLIASALIALSMAASGSALAQRGDHGHDRNDRTQWQNNDRHDSGRYDNDRNDRRYDNDRNDRRYDNERSERRDGPRGHSAYRDNDGRHDYRDDSRGGGPRHDLRRGQRLGHAYRGNRYVVNDWRARRLSAPPRGHHWVRAGNDYVLAAIATGIIAQVLLGN